MKTNNIKIIMGMIFLILFVNIVSAEIYYNISLEYNNGEIKTKGVNVVYSLYDLTPSDGEYRLELYDFNKNKIDSYLFYVPNIIMGDQADENGTFYQSEVTELNNFNFNVYIPYNKNAKEIIVYANETVALDKKDVSIYSKQIIEENIKNNGLIETIEDKNTNNNLIIIIIVIAIILIISGIAIIIYIKKVG